MPPTHEPVPAGAAAGPGRDAPAQPAATPRKAYSPAQLVLKRFLRNRLAIAGVVILLLMFLFSFLGVLLMPYGEYQMFYEKDGQELSVSGEAGGTLGGEDVRILSKAPPSARHLLGTDKEGRDVFTRLMYGGRVSLVIGFVVVLIELVLGIVLGGLAGYYGGFIDGLIMRTVDVFNCIPQFPVMLILSSILNTSDIRQEHSIYYLMAILAILGWASVARLVRGQILTLREQEYMTAAKAAGIGTGSQIFRHLIPNVMPQLIVIATLNIGGIILTEAALSYLGMGVRFPMASWGNMVQAATDPFILTGNPNIWVPPGLCILLTVLGFNFIGDGLRDAFDPKMRR